MIPVFVLTGFLGSGKTTLLGRLLRHPSLARTAVIINEFGEIGLDHELVASSSESLIELTTGCLCCAVRGDLAVTLADLLRQRDQGTIAPFERIVVETSGMADPAPILQLLMTDSGLAERLALAGVITTVDAATGLATLAREPQSVRQAAIADRLVITKTDLTGGLPEPLRDRLDRLNPGAQRLIASFGEIEPEALLDPGLYHPSAKGGDAMRWLGAMPEQGGTWHEAEAHDPGIVCHAITRAGPIRAMTLTLLVETLAEHCGADLLRLKGIIHLAESPQRPAVVHGVQHVVHPIDLLERWPSQDRRSRLVVIGRNIPRGWVEALIDVLEAEVEGSPSAEALAAVPPLRHAPGEEDR